MAKSKTKEYVNPMLGRKISKEDRGPDAPKLGRPFLNEDAKRYTISLSVSEDMMNQILSDMATDKKGTAIRMLIESHCSN